MVQIICNVYFFILLKKIEVLFFIIQLYTIQKSRYFYKLYQLDYQVDNCSERLPLITSLLSSEKLNPYTNNIEIIYYISV